MSTGDASPPKVRSEAHSSGPAGPYGPQNNLNSTQQPTFVNSQDRRYEAPKFGSTSPMRSSVPAGSPGTSLQPGQPGYRGEQRDMADHHPHISKVRARAQEFLEPIAAKLSLDNWRTKPIDLTGPSNADEDAPTIIPRPQNFPTFAAPVPDGGSRHFVDGLPVKQPPMYSLPGGGAVPGSQGTYYGGAYVDSAKTTESIKALLEGINDEPVSRRSRKKKAKKEEADLAELLEESKLTDEKEEEEVEEEEEDLSIVDGLNVTLLPHQIRGLSFMLSREEGKARGGILADDMGLGKTIQSIALLLSHTHPDHPVCSKETSSSVSPESKKHAPKLPSDQEKATLVIAPLALIKQWEAEISNRTSDTHRFRVCVHHGPSRAKEPRALRRFDVVITTYDVIRSEHNQGKGTDPVGCFGLRWWRIILDEAHSIKNRLAKSSLAACDLKARYRWCLTGTPLQNNLDELQSLIKFLRVAPFDDLAVWKEQISRPMQNNRGGVAIERLRVVLGAIMLRRTKDVLKQDAEKQLAEGGGESKMKLPERRMEKIVATFDERELAFYEKLETRTEESLEKMLSGFGGSAKGIGSNMTSALVLLLRLRQACNHPQLVAGKIVKDKDSGLGLATPRKKKATSKLSQDDPDLENELADLLGGLSVDARKCDVCFANLTKEERQNGEVQCADCREDLEVVGRTPEKEKLGMRKKKHGKSKKEKTPKLKKRQRRRVVDSDDEEDDEGSQAEEGTDTSEDEDDENEPRSTKGGFIDSEAEESEDAEEESESEDEYSEYANLVISTKIKHLLGILKKELKDKKKTIVFSQFTSMLDLIEPFLHRDGIVFTRYDGSMKNDDREASLRRLRGEGEFTHRSKTKPDRNWTGVLLCSLKCGALGLNLTCASRVVILEPFWNPFIEEQAIDRVHRIGQTTDVVVYKLTVANTVEERILKLQEAKRELARAAIGDGDLGTNAKAAKLSMKDIMYLFKRDAENTRGGGRHDTVGLATKTRILKDRHEVTREKEEREKEMNHGRDVSGRYGGSARDDEQRERRRNDAGVFGTRG